MSQRTYVFLIAAVVYFALVFAVGTILGTLRVLVVAPEIGGVAAVLLELPLMLGVSWFVARTLVMRLRRPVTTADLTIMGSAALVLLLGTEFLLGVWGFGRSSAEQLTAWLTPEGVLGLLGQLAFGAIPLFVRRQTP
jgi:hypothetical protein